MNEVNKEKEVLFLLRKVITDYYLDTKNWEGLKLLYHPNWEKIVIQEETFPFIPLVETIPRASLESCKVYPLHKENQKNKQRKGNCFVSLYDLRLTEKEAQIIYDFFKKNKEEE